MRDVLELDNTKFRNYVVRHRTAAAAETPKLTTAYIHVSLSLIARDAIKFHVCDGLQYYSKSTKVESQATLLRFDKILSRYCGFVVQFVVVWTFTPERNGDDV